MNPLHLPIVATVMAGVGVPLADTTGSSVAMAAAKPILDSVEQLVQQRPFTTDLVERQLGMVLVPVAEESNQYFNVYRSEPGTISNDNAFSGVELRVPVAETSGRDGLVIVSVSPDQCIDRDAVTARLGAGEPVPPSPSQPTSLPVFVKYRFDWGTASFGYARAEPRCLKKVVLDATGA